MAKRATFGGCLSIGLIEVGIKAYPMIDREDEFGLHWVHEPCKARLSVGSMICTACGASPTVGDGKVRALITYSEERKSDDVLTFTDAELEALAPEQGTRRVLHVREVVQPRELDTSWHDASYFIAPATPADRRPYFLLWRSLMDMERVAITTYTFHGRAYYATIMPHPTGLRLHTMHFPHRLRDLAMYEIDRIDTWGMKPERKEIVLFSKLLSALQAKFDITRYPDTVREAFIELVKHKRQGRPSVPLRKEPPERSPKVLDLLEALQRSIETIAPKRAHASTTAKARRTARR